MHAYLIMAHNNFNILEKLIELLDYKDNDIYIHIDKKVKKFDFKYYQNICKFSNVYFTKKRMDIKWGHPNQVKLEMLLFKTAAKKHYDYYHLISGTDLPLKNQNEIHNFFKNNKKNYVTIENINSEFDYIRLSQYRVYNDKKNRYKTKIIAFLNIIQEKLKIDRIRKLEFGKGSNWCSVTDDFVQYMIKKKFFVKKLVFASVCADECYKQILILNSIFKNTIIANDYTGMTENLRLIEWIDGEVHPKVFVLEDYEKIISSGKTFARKFDENIDMDIVNKIYDYVKSQ